RVVPHRTRVLVLDRDRGCRFPGCPTSSADYLEVHHLTHWRDGGLTDLDNLACLCTFHHDSHHRGEYAITGDPTTADGLRFDTRQGWPIGPPTRSPKPSPDTPIGPPPRPRRPRPRLGRSYPAPTGGTLHLHLVDLTPSRAAPRRE
ncbi:HNH endonuclease signature motif containing protein, partial [Intrasporangium sp. YIM S08009]|uniref:HNH endonuclease signature motif containing protein n=1 Tax=Intrasporangium zincisolvens TaxID=3080018 RepID=UPI002B061EB4